MSDWLEKKVKELCIIGRGRVISQDEINSNPGIYPVFSSQTANNGEMGKIETFDFEGEYVTWTTDGANAGTVFYRSGRFNCTNVCGTLKEKENDSLDLQFFSYLLSTEAKKHVSYIGNPKLMNGVMAEVKLNLPKDKPEQTRIAEILSTADEAIAHTEALIAKYQRIKTGLMQDLLTRGIDENGNIRSKATHKFVVKNGIEAPEEWEVVELSSLVGNDSPIVYGILMPGYGYENGIPVVKVKDIRDEQILLNDLLLTSPEIAKSYERSSLKQGDLLFTIRGTVGRCAFVPKELDGANITQDTARIRVSGISPLFLRFCFELEFLKRYIDLHTIGQAVKGINLKDLRKMPIPKPILNESDIIAQKINSIQNIIDSLNSNLLKLQSLKTGLMQDLLSGKVRVNIN